MKTSTSPGEPRLTATRKSLVERLTNWEDQRNWEEFFETYWRLIYGVARQSGLTDAEAQDVVQETVITVAKNITKYEREAGSFKAWLLHITRWRIADQFRKRAPATAKSPTRDSSRGTATIDRVPDGIDLRDVWDAEWRQHLFQSALQRVKRKVDAKHYQIFDCLIVKQWLSPESGAASLCVSIAQVYIVKHRLSAQLKKEVALLEKHH